MKEGERVFRRERERSNKTRIKQQEDDIERNYQERMQAAKRKYDEENRELRERRMMKAEDRNARAM